MTITREHVTRCVLGNYSGKILITRDIQLIHASWCRLIGALLVTEIIVEHHLVFIQVELRKWIKV